MNEALKPDRIRTWDRYSMYGPFTRARLIEQARKAQPGFDPARDLQSTNYNAQCDELCRICDAQEKEQQE